MKYFEMTPTLFWLLPWAMQIFWSSFLRPGIKMGQRIHLYICLSYLVSCADTRSRRPRWRPSRSRPAEGRGRRRRGTPCTVQPAGGNSCRTIECHTICNVIPTINWVTTSNNWNWLDLFWLQIWICLTISATPVFSSV